MLSPERQPDLWNVLSWGSTVMPDTNALDIVISAGAFTRFTSVCSADRMLAADEEEFDEIDLTWI